MLTDGKVSFWYVCAPGGRRRRPPSPLPRRASAITTSASPVAISLVHIIYSNGTTERLHAPKFVQLLRLLQSFANRPNRNISLHADLTSTFSTDVRCPIFYLLQLDESHTSNAQSTNPLIHPKLERDTFTPGDRGIPSMVILYY